MTVKERFLALLKQGLTPEKLAASLAVGLGLAVFPMLGATTLLCGLTAWAFRLNQPAVQLANYLAYPLQLALLIPFIRMGEWLFHSPRLPLNAAQIVAAVKADAAGAIRLLWQSTWHAVVAWLLIVPLAALLLGWALVPLLRRPLRRFA